MKLKKSVKNDAKTSRNADGATETSAKQESLCFIKARLTYPGMNLNPRPPFLWQKYGLNFARVGYKSARQKNKAGYTAIQSRTVGQEQ